jgi:hypothetical protein
MFAHTMARVGTSKVAVPDVIDDPVANKVVIFASSKADLNAGEGPYGQTDVLSLGFDEPGTEITQIVDFVDSTKAKEQAGGIRRLNKYKCEVRLGEGEIRNLNKRQVVWN